MDFDDIVYLALLFGSIGFGHMYRGINDTNQRKNVGTLVGLIIVFIVSGKHILHSFITVFVNAAIILLVNKKKCHIVSFVFSFLYLFFFRTTEYFGIPYPPAHTNMVQMIMTLKLVGLAFEVNKAHLEKKKPTVERSDDEEEKIQYDNVNVNFPDVFHYAFNYVGVLTGPYYRYTTFKDSFNLPFSYYSPWKEATLQKLIHIPLFAILYLIGSYIWPISYAMADEFYSERSFLYRFLYVWPNFFVFRMRIYIGLVLSECVCTMAGVGAYPEFTEPKPGLGPSKNHKKLKEITLNPKQLEKEGYSFEAIHNINPYCADFCITFREGMKHWNMCIQYWLAMNVYKRFPNKKFRTTATVMVSAAWHGIYTGHYVCIGGVPIYLPIEDIYVKLFLKDNKGTSLKIWEWIIWFFKMFTFSYLAIAFHLLSLPKIWHYYNSIYHAGLVIWITMYFVGYLLLKARRAKERNSAKKAE